MKRILVAVVVLCVATAYANADGYTYQRMYRPGERYAYRLTTDTFTNGKLSSESIAEARLQVVSKDGAPFDRVAFVSLKETNDPTGGEFRQLNALRVMPFDI